MIRSRWMKTTRMSQPNGQRLDSSSSNLRANYRSYWKSKQRMQTGTTNLMMKMIQFLKIQSRIFPPKSLKSKSRPRDKKKKRESGRNDKLLPSQWSFRNVMKSSRRSSQSIWWIKAWKLKQCAWWSNSIAIQELANSLRQYLRRLEITPNC